MNAEDERSDNPATMAWGLQWGRVRMNAEITIVFSRRLDKWASFNGAAFG